MDERDGNDSGTEWEVLGVHAWAVEQWKSAGFSPFEAAMAQGDGFTPMFAGQFRRTLRTICGCLDSCCDRAFPSSAVASSRNNPKAILKTAI